MPSETNNNKTPSEISKISKCIYDKFISYITDTSNSFVGKDELSTYRDAKFNADDEPAYATVVGAYAAVATALTPYLSVCDSTAPQGSVISGVQLEVLDYSANHKSVNVSEIKLKIPSNVDGTTLTAEEIAIVDDAWWSVTGGRSIRRADEQRRLRNLGYI